MPSVLELRSADSAYPWAFPNWRGTIDAVPCSQNLRFVAQSAPPDEFDHPGGDGLMRQLCGDLGLAGWTVAEIDDWRDCGFSASCEHAARKLNLTMTKLSEEEFMIQIHPESDPGWLGRWLAKIPSATPSDVFELSVAVHRALASRDCLRRPRWCWDGFPEDENSTEEPKPPA